MTSEPYTVCPEEQTTLAAHNALARRWNSFTKPRFADPYMQSFMSHVEPDGMVFDLGCGTALDAELLLKREFRYLGVDLSLPMVAVGRQWLTRWRRKRRARLAVMNIAELALRDESCSGFWALMSFMHIPRENLPRVLREARRVLKPGGVGFMSLPNGTTSGMHRSGTTGMETLIVAWRPVELATTLRDAGFTILNLTELGQILIATVMKANE